MADFIETSKSRNAKRTYDNIADAAFGCSDQSLSPDVELLPQPLCGR